MPPAQEAAPVDEPEKPYTWYWDLLKSIPEQKWGTVNSVLGWRLDPKVPSRPGSKGFLFEVFQAITPMWMKENYGGGKFRCILLENGRFKTTHDFDIEGAPKYDLTREQPNAAAPVASTNGDKSTELLQQFVGVLRDELKNAREANGNMGGNDRVIEMITNASDKAIEIVTKQTPQGTDQLTQLTQMASLLKTLMPPPADSGLTGLLAPLLKPLIEKLMAPTDPMAQITMFLTIFEKLDTLRGGGGESKPKDWRAMLAEGAVQKAPEILKEIKDIVGTTRDTAVERRAAAEAQARAMEIARTMPPAGAPAQPPAAPSVMPNGPLRVVPLDGAPPAVQTEIHQEAQPAPAAAPGMSVNESDAVAAFMKRRIVEMIAEKRDAEDVVDFIEDVDPTVNDYLVSYSVDMVTTFLQADPILAKATQTKGWNIFLTKAQEYIQQIRAEDAMIEANANAVPS